MTELALVTAPVNAPVPAEWAKTVIVPWSYEEGRTPGEIKDLLDNLETAVHHLRKKKQDFEELQKAQRYLEIRLGELMQPYTNSQRSRSSVNLPGGVQASYEYHRLALNKKDCEKWMDEGDLARSRLLARIKAKEAAEMQVPLDGMSKLPGLTDERLYQVILADPPWRYDFTETPTIRAIENQYTTMSLSELKELEIPATDDSVLFLWVTVPKLEDGLELMNSWGFRYVSNFTWCKEQIGMGYHWRGAHEHLLKGTRGKLPLPPTGARLKSWRVEPRGAHSVKPESVMEDIEAMYPGLSWLEMFARRNRPGWTSWGHQITVDADIIYDETEVVNNSAGR